MLSRECPAASFRGPPAPLGCACPALCGHALSSWLHLLPVLQAHSRGCKEPPSPVDTGEGGPSPLGHPLPLLCVSSPHLCLLRPPALPLPSPLLPCSLVLPVPDSALGGVPGCLGCVSLCCPCLCGWPLCVACRAATTPSPWCSPRLRGRRCGTPRAATTWTACPPTLQSTR